MTHNHRKLPWGGARCQNLGHLQKVIFCFPVMKTIDGNSWSDISQPYDIDLYVMRWWSPWPTFHSQWFCLISWRLFNGWTSNFWKMSQYDTMFDLKISVGHCDLYFMVQWFCLISWRLFDIWTSYFGIMSQYDRMFDLKINLGHCDLYFMVQWFCLISWRQSDKWTSYFRIMSQYNLLFHLKINVGQCDLYFIDFVLYLEDCLIYGHHTLGLWVDMTQYLISNKFRSLWLVFHGPVVLPYIVKTIWSINIILWDYEPVWPEVWPQNISRSLWPTLMVHWFCLVSWRLFDILASYFVIMSQCNADFDPKWCRSQWPIF